MIENNSINMLHIGYLSGKNMSCAKYCSFIKFRTHQIFTNKTIPILKKGQKTYSHPSYREISNS